MEIAPNGLEPRLGWSMLIAMKALLVSSFLALVPVAALAAGPVAVGQNGGKYGQWTAASYGQGQDKVCYAFVHVQSSSPAIPSRGKVMLTVSERHDVHNEVSVTAGYDYPRDAKVTLTVGTQSFPLYTQRNVAFSSAGAQAVAAFKIGNSATVVSPLPHGQGHVSDMFSLAGFSDAYNAIVKACR